MDKQIVIPTQAFPSFYEVRCAVCREPLIAPDTKMGRLLWSEQEARQRPIVTCPTCHTVQQPQIALIVPAA